MKVTPLQFAGDNFDMMPMPQGGLYGDLTSLSTIEGQNTSPPSEKVFGNHRIMKFGALYYDPSYGQTFTDTNHFVDSAIDGYAIEHPSDNPPGYTNHIIRVKQATGVYEIQFTVE